MLPSFIGRLSRGKVLFAINGNANRKIMFVWSAAAAAAGNCVFCQFAMIVVTLFAALLFTSSTEYSIEGGGMSGSTMLIMPFFVSSAASNHAAKRVVEASLLKDFASSKRPVLLVMGITRKL